MAWKELWRDKDSVDTSWYISANLHPEDALIFFKLLFPNFIIKKGAVILEDRFSDENFQSWYEKLNGDIISVEKIMNHIHLYDVFGGCSDGVDDLIYAQLADVISLAWRLLLKDKFPDKEFRVIVSNTAQDYGPTVTFFQCG